MKNFTVLKGLLPAGLFFITSPVWAQTISTTSTTAQTLSTGTLTVTSTGVLNVGSGGSSPSGNGTVAITVTGSSTIANSGTIEELDNSAASDQNGRAIRLNTAHVTLIVNNNAGALIETGDADVFQATKPSDSVTLNNYGTLTSLNASANGAQAIDWNAITASGSNTLNNYSTGLIQASNADSVRPGVNGVVTNDGTIKSTATTDTSSDGIDAQTNTGISITNANTNTSNALIEGARRGITGGPDPTTDGTFTMSITNNSLGVIQGDDGSGVNISGFNAKEVVTINNAGSILGNGVTGDGDGIDVDGLVNLTNTGTIHSLNSNDADSEGVTVGGGTIVNSGTIEGSLTSAGIASGSISHGITLGGIDRDPTTGDPIPIQTIYANTSVTNNTGGLIRGDTDAGIEIRGISGPTTFTVTITNNAGATIEGGGASVAAIEAGASVNNLAVMNSGTIEADSSGLAIDFGSGTNSLQVTGGSASIIGNITGGTGTNSLTIDPGAGNAFSYAGVISNFSSVQNESGTVTFTGASTYSGPTTISGGTTYVNNTTGSGTGTGSVGVSSGATLGGAGIIQPGSGNSVTLAATGTLISGGVQSGTTAGNGLTLDNTVAQGTLLDASVGGSGGANLTFYLGAGSTAGAGANTFGIPNTNSTYMKVLDDGGLDAVGELKLAANDTITLTDLTNGNLQLNLSIPYLLIQVDSNNDYSGLTTTGGTDLSGNILNGYVTTSVTLAGNTAGEYPGLSLYLSNGDLEVVPEPNTRALMLGGLAVIIFIQIRRRFHGQAAI